MAMTPTRRASTARAALETCLSFRFRCTVTERLQQAFGSLPTEQSPYPT